MKITRRDSLKYAALAGGALVGSPLASAAQSTGQGPKRFVFFIYGNGLHPDHVCPQGLRDTRKTDKLIDEALAPHKLPKWTEPLEPYKDRMTILQGVNGRHCNTSHGSPFGCLAGLKKGKSPRGQTIDYALSRLMPRTPLPMLGIGLSQLTTMQATPITYSCSAAGPSQPIPLYSDPRMAFQNIFGCVAGDKSRDAFLSETTWFTDLLEDSDRIRRRLSGTELAKFDTYLNGLRQAKQQRFELMAMKQSLAKFKPQYTEAFDNPP